MKLVQEKHIVPAVWPVDLNTAPNPGDYVSLKNYNHVTVDISIGVTTGTCAVTLLQAKDVAATGAKALAFTQAFMTGVKLKVNTKTGSFTVGETVTGNGGGAGVVYKDNGDHLLLYTVNATAFVNAETITGGTSGITAVADGIGIDSDILIPFAVASNTFTIPAVSNRKYVIEVDAAELDLANDFDCMSVALADASNGCIGSANYILSEARYKAEPMPTAIYD